MKEKKVILVTAAAEQDIMMMTGTIVMTETYPILIRAIVILSETAQEVLKVDGRIPMMTIKCQDETAV